MYQLTYIAGDELHAICSPSYRAIEELYFNMPNRMRARFWHVQGSSAVLLG